MQMHEEFLERVIWAIPGQYEPDGFLDGIVGPMVAGCVLASLRSGSKLADQY
jgi:hypothetical protein